VNVDPLTVGLVVAALFCLRQLGRKLRQSTTVSHEAKLPPQPFVLRRWHTREWWRWLAWWWTL
jgi:hypothetical protein